MPSAWTTGTDLPSTVAYQPGNQASLTTRSPGRSALTATSIELSPLRRVAVPARPGFEPDGQVVHDVSISAVVLGSKSDLPSMALTMASRGSLRVAPTTKASGNDGVCS